MDATMSTMEKQDRNDVPLDQLVFNAEVGGVADIARPDYKPLHPEIYTYNERFIDPVARTTDYEKFIHEDVEQIYRWQLFTPEFCRLLIEEAEHSGKWETRRDIEDNPIAGDGFVKNYSPWDTTQWLDNMPGLGKVYVDIVQRHVEPIINMLWPVFRIQRMKRPYILKYEPSVVANMGLHYDVETVTLLVYLNKEFEGGGTYFPRWNYRTGTPPVGTAILYPGGLSHVHEGLGITAGKRYLFCGAYF